MRYVRETYPRIDKEFIETGRLKYAVFDMPIESIHTMAFLAAEAARCAGEQGKYWEMRTQLFANPQTLNQTGVHARAVGLDGPKFDACVGSGKYRDEIRRDIVQAQGAGISGTPGFVLATLDARGAVKVQRVMIGAEPFESFKAEIEVLLGRQQGTDH